jgi:Zn-dependent peptidase ImmA (M78 family)
MYTIQEHGTMLTEIPAEQVAEAIKDCAEELLAEAGFDRPPIDAIAMAQRLGLVVAKDSQSDVRGRFVRMGFPNRMGRGTIFLANEPRVERRQWATAHEIGEFAAHRVFGMLGVDAEEIAPSEREQMANHLANGILLPSDWFRADGYAVDWDLYELKQVYTTASHELIARRMIAMAPAVIVSLFDQGRLVWRKSNVLRRPPPLVPAESRTWQVAHEDNQPAQYECRILPEGLRDVRCWPVHEAGWKREILRTALEDW